MVIVVAGLTNDELHRFYSEAKKCKCDNCSCEHGCSLD